MVKNGIPDRWLPYSPMGSIIPGTRFIACKVPLKDGLLRKLPENERFGPKDLLEAFPKMGLLIDLTNTTRYYFKQDFTDKNIRYEKIFCPGKVVPPNSIVKQFFNVVDDYLASEEDPDTVIVVHCTHGVNRTGYFICRYMIESLNMSPEEALKNFQMARGHDIERDIYVSDLKNGCKGGNESDLCFVSNRGFGRDRKIDSRRHKTDSRRGFHGVVSDRHDGIPEKRERNDYKQNPYNYYPNEKWKSSKQRQKYFNNFDRQQNPEEESKYSYNWRDHRNDQNLSFPSTTPLPQFTPVHRQVNHQGSSIPPYQPPNPPHHEQPPSAMSYDGAVFPKRVNFTGHPYKQFREAPKGFNPLPKFCHPETSNEVAPSSRLAGGSVSDPDNSYYASVRSTMPSSGLTGHFRGKRSSRGRGRGSGRGCDNRSGSRSWSRGNGPQRNNYSR